MPSELREALTAAGASALVPKIISPLLLEYQRRYSPLVRSIPQIKWDSDEYYFNQRTQVASGGFVPDGGARPVSTSTYVQTSFQMKHVQAVGAVTGYAQEVTRQIISDLRRTEIQGAIRGYYWDIETGLLWGNAAATAGQAQPQFDGLDSLVSSFDSSGGFQNAVDQGGASLTLAMLDQLIDLVETNAAMPVFDSTWQIILSNTAMSKVAQLLTNQQRFNDRVQVAAGLLVPTYRDIPLIKTSFLSSRSFQMSVVTPSTGSTGGSLPASTTYRYVMTAIMARQGEILPCAEVSQATGTGATNTVILSFTPPTGLEGAAPIGYKVYRTVGGGGAGTETFLGYVDATVGLSSDGVTPIITNQIVDTGTALVPQNATGPVAPSPLSATYFGTNALMKPPAAGEENIYLISRDRNFVVRPYVREATPLNVYPTTASPDSLPYAVIGDTCLALRAPKYTGRLARVTVGL
jgi:hypothetical protein